MSAFKGRHTPKILLIIGCVFFLCVVLFLVFCFQSVSATSDYTIYLRFALDAGVASDGVYVTIDTGRERLSDDSVRKLYYYLTANKILSLQDGDMEDPNCIELTMGPQDSVLIVPVGDRKTHSIVHLFFEGRHYRILTKYDDQWMNFQKLTGPSGYYVEQPSESP